MSYSHYFNVMCRMMCSGVVCAYFKKLRRRLSPEDPRGEVRADALGSVLQVHVGRFWGLLGWDTFLVSDLGWETGFGLLSPS